MPICRSLTPLLLLPLLVVACVATMTGCSTFERDWKALADRPVSESAMEGRWSGTWVSDVSGHGGGLRCIITRTENDTLHARYRATYGAGLTFEYDMPMTVEREGETFRFAAEADLGWLAGGRYTYDGTVVGDEFTSTYRSKSDHGTFRMMRVRQ